MFNPILCLKYRRLFLFLFILNASSQIDTFYIFAEPHKLVIHTSAILSYVIQKLLIVHILFIFIAVKTKNDLGLISFSCRLVLFAQASYIFFLIFIIAL